MAWPVIGFIILQCFLLIRVDAQNGNFGGWQNADCRTPNNLNGNCIGIRLCPPLVAILTSRPLRQESVDFLRLSQCGFETLNPKDPKVCCPIVNNNNGENGGGTSTDGDGNGSRGTDGNNGNGGRGTDGNNGNGGRGTDGNNGNGGRGTDGNNGNGGRGTDGNNGNGGPDTGGNGNGQVTVNNRNNPLLPDDCGRDLSQRIVGGEITELDEFPWMALLEYRKPSGTTTACGGVLISRRYVMTAAHCIKGKDLPRTWTLTSVRLGEYDTSTDQDCLDDGGNARVCADNPVSIGIEEQIVHEQYKPASRDQRYDVALLRLTRDVEFTNFIKPICLPSNSTFPQKFYVAGWGKTETRSESNVKLKLSLSLADANTCTQKYRNAGVNLGEGQVCAGGQRGKDSCRGDSGGPLMSLERSPAGDIRWTAIGIVSFGPSPCGMLGWPGVYTKVHDYVPWAVSKIRQ